MLRSDWLIPNFLRSDWLQILVASFTTMRIMMKALKMKTMIAVFNKLTFK